MMDKCDERVLRAVARAVAFEAERTKVVERERDDLLARVERAEAERDALRALLRRVLSCGLNEYPPGAGFTPSKQERLAGELARDIKDALREGK